MVERFEFDEMAMEHINSAMDKAFDAKLGPMMKAEVKKNTPIDTGALIDSVYYEVDREKHELNVGATGDETRKDPKRRYYAAWVELGHRVFVYGRDTGKVRQPTAFIRKALYRRYPGF